MKNYVSIVLSKINNKTQRTQIESELQSHIDDRTDYYVNAGYDLETATQKANEHMGETAELVGEQLNALKKSKLNIILTVLLAFSSVVFILEICAYSIYGKEQFFSSQLGLMISTEFFVVAFMNLFVALRVKRNFLSYLSSFMFLLYGAASLGNNSIVFSICELVKGNYDSVIELFKFYTWKCDNVFINVLGVAFSIACFAFSVGVAVHIRKFNKLDNGRNFYKFEKCFKIISILASAVIILVYPTIVYSQPAYDNPFAKMDSYEGFFFWKVMKRLLLKKFIIIRIIVSGLTMTFIEMQIMLLRVRMPVIYMMKMSI